MFTGLEHLAIASPAPQQLAQWYVETLGFRINFEYDGNFFIRAQDGGMIEIIPSQGERQEPSRARQDSGTWRFQWTISTQLTPICKSLESSLRASRM